MNPVLLSVYILLALLSAGAGGTVCFWLFLQCRLMWFAQIAALTRPVEVKEEPQPKPAKARRK